MNKRINEEKHISINFFHLSFYLSNIYPLLKRLLIKNRFQKHLSLMKILIEAKKVLDGHC